MLSLSGIGHPEASSAETSTMEQEKQTDDDAYEGAYSEVTGWSPVPSSEASESYSPTPLPEVDNKPIPEESKHTPEDSKPAPAASKSPVREVKAEVLLMASPIFDHAVDLTADPEPIDLTGPGEVEIKCEVELAPKSEPVKMKPGEREVIDLSLDTPEIAPQPSPAIPKPLSPMNKMATPAAVIACVGDAPSPRRRPRRRKKRLSLGNRIAASSLPPHILEQLAKTLGNIPVPTFGAAQALPVSELPGMKPEPRDPETMLQGTGFPPMHHFPGPPGAAVKPEMQMYNSDGATFLADLSNRELVRRANMAAKMDQPQLRPNRNADPYAEDNIGPDGEPIKPRTIAINGATVLGPLFRSPYPDRQTCFSTTSQLYKHIKSNQPKRGLRQLECPYCGKMSTCNVNLVYHVRTHTGEKPYCCPIPGCSFRSATKFNLKVHLKSTEQHKNGGPHVLDLWRSALDLDTDNPCTHRSRRRSELASIFGEYPSGIGEPIAANFPLPFNPNMSPEEFAQIVAMQLQQGANASCPDLPLIRHPGFPTGLEGMSQQMSHAMQGLPSPGIPRVAGSVPPPLNMHGMPMVGLGLGGGHYALPGILHNPVKTEMGMIPPQPSMQGPEVSLVPQAILPEAPQTQSPSALTPQSQLYREEMFGMEPGDASEADLLEPLPLELEPEECAIPLPEIDELRPAIQENVDFASGNQHEEICPQDAALTSHEEMVASSHLTGPCPVSNGLDYELATRCEKRDYQPTASAEAEQMFSSPMKRRRVEPEAAPEE